MGCLFVIVLAGVSAGLIALFGYSLWVMVVLGMLWLTALVVSALAGHRGFGGHGNADLQIAVAGAAITAAIIIPHYNAQKPCNQAKIALTKLADAENNYFSGHKAFTTELNFLNPAQNPEVSLMILKADEQSFIASASHGLCKKDKSGTPHVFMWDSAKGGLQ
jgi:hypothetical protein